MKELVKYETIIKLHGSTNPENWKDIIVNERAFIPRKLAALYFANQDYPQQWDRTSAVLAPAIYLGLRKELNDLYCFCPLHVDQEEIKNVSYDLKLNFKSLVTGGDYTSKCAVFEHYYRFFPYLPCLVYEMAIASDMLMKKDGAFELVKSAILLEPDNKAQWQSLAVISNSVGEERNAMIAHYMAEELN